MALIETNSTASREVLKSASLENIVYGAGCVGELVAKACEKLNINISAFCDNSPVKQGSTISGIGIISPEQASKLYPNGNYIIALSDSVALAMAVDKLNNLGINKCFSVQFADGIVEESDLLRNTMLAHNSIVNGSNELVFSTGLYITDKCTLRCVDCGSFIPYISDPLSVMTKSIINDIDLLCLCADALLGVSFIGGEPFLHPEWDKLLKYASNQGKIHSVYIATNGTYMPQENQWEALQHEKITVIISDYEGLSLKAKKLAERLEKLGAKYIYRRWTDWYEFLATTKKERDQSALQAHFLNCWFNNCTMVSEHRMYRCGTMLNGMKTGFFPDISNEYLELSLTKNSDAILDLRNKIRAFLFGKTIFQICDHCKGGGNNRTVVHAGRQISNRSF